MTNWIYLDNNATTKLDERVLETMLPYLTELYGNAGSAHLMGLTINDAIE
ncbi:MAG TPA: aminotransferase class V-fold PLP-dependent enzyme, partial [Emticicia sp.]